MADYLLVLSFRAPVFKVATRDGSPFYPFCSHDLLSMAIKQSTDPLYLEEECR